MHIYRQRFASDITCGRVDAIVIAANCGHHLDYQRGRTVWSLSIDFVNYLRCWFVGASSSSFCVCEKRGSGLRYEYTQNIVILYMFIVYINMVSGACAMRSSSCSQSLDDDEVAHTHKAAVVRTSDIRDHLLLSIVGYLKARLMLSS